MEDFSWLNKIPDEGWSPQGKGIIRGFDLNKFLAISRASPHGWRDRFDIWGQSQPRHYQQFVGPDSAAGVQLAWIVGGAWDQVGDQDQE
ncbi:hypothetical protein [Stenotrophomonas maltophilia]|uniref:hypothetical protein n=1 Tax=Stenotrophomonas maltophilia TaxID=40324 RepID=UPI0007F034CD|nr:hypothetical protein [Stenotrophomonas maltophilia]OBU48496.1 hypothetical protein A9K76_15625 [Stenotrophomonas maltophilia]